MVLVFSKSADEEVKIQSKLQGLNQSVVSVVLPAKNSHVYVDATVKVYFFVKNFEFWFDSKIVQLASDVHLHLTKPKTIHKRKQRSSKRLFISTSIKFGLWEKTGLYEGLVSDISTTGCRFQTDQFINKNQLLNIDIYISEPRHKIRIMCQALVTWVEREQLYEKIIFKVGILFTTASSGSIEKLDQFINEKTLKDTGRSNRNTDVINTYKNMYKDF